MTSNKTVEWPWDKPEIVMGRQMAAEGISDLGKEPGNFVSRILLFRTFIDWELTWIYGTMDARDLIDGGLMTAFLLAANNFTEEQTAKTAGALRRSIFAVEHEKLKYFSEAKQTSDLVDGTNNVVNDLWFVMSFLDDWCFTAIHKDWTKHDDWLKVEEAALS